MAMRKCVVGFITIVLVALVLASFGDAEERYHEFVIQETPVKRLCTTVNVLTVNGQFPGPTLEVFDGDTLVIKTTNLGQYNATLHWHGVRQLRNGWADGPEFVTQCPIRPGGTYTYRFTIQGQEGTLWWHAHSSWLRATVYGALIIRPKPGKPYPFPPPAKEFPVLLGEWWNRDPIGVIRQATFTGAAPNSSDARTINGQPGDFYPCSAQETTVIPVAAGETILLRVVNSAMADELFFTVAGHSMTVVAADAAYVKPFATPVVMLGPGQTTDVLVTANQPPGRYYAAARAYAPAQGVPFDNTTASAILEYKFSSCPTLRGNAAGGVGLGRPHGPNAGPKPVMPVLPAYNDSATVAALVAAHRSPSPVQVPDPVDENLFITVGLGQFSCPPGPQCGGPNNTRFAASMNNVSFQLPNTVSLLQANYLGAPGVFTDDFPPTPPIIFDFTGNNTNSGLQQPVPGTKLYRLKYRSVVQVVFQGTSIFAADEHPMHIHGYQFYVLATGTGNYNPVRDVASFNLVDPPLRNTIGVPVGGWAVIRFVADNPGVWLVHCHLDQHLTWGLAMAFLVEDGAGELEATVPPPLDLPLC